MSLEKGLAVAIFLVAYALLVSRRGRPLLVVWCGAALLLITGVVSPREALLSINVNVIGIFLGTMILSEFFVHSKVPAHMASVLVDRARTPAWALLSVCILSGAVSAVVDNVATVLMIIPIAFEVSRRLKVSPAPFLIGIAVSANLQGAATMIGDSTSILLASAAKMTFVDFFWMDGRPGIFFAVELAAAGSIYVLYRVLCREKGHLAPVDPVHVTSWVPAILMGLMLVIMAVSSFVAGRPEWATGAISLGFAAAALLWNAVTNHKEMSLTRDVDWSTVFLLAGLFVLIGGLTITGIVGDIAGLISNLTRGNLFLAYNVVVWMSVLFSAFVDNIPYTMAMLPVAGMVAANLGASPNLMMFGLLLGTTLGGNITPIGASANVVVVSALRRNGYDVSFRDFLRIGLPFTLVAVTAGSLFIWMVWR